MNMYDQLIVHIHHPSVPIQRITENELQGPRFRECIGTVSYDSVDCLTHAVKWRGIVAVGNIPSAVEPINRSRAMDFIEVLVVHTSLKQ